MLCPICHMIRNDDLVIVFETSAMDIRIKVCDACLEHWEGLDIPDCITNRIEELQSIGDERSIDEENELQFLYHICANIHREKMAFISKAIK